MHKSRLMATWLFKQEHDSSQQFAFRHFIERIVIKIIGHPACMKSRLFEIFTQRVIGRSDGAIGPFKKSCRLFARGDKSGFRAPIVRQLPGHREADFNFQMVQVHILIANKGRPQGFLVLGNDVIDNLVINRPHDPG